jgi:hypothetical protein
MDLLLHSSSAAGVPQCLLTFAICRLPFTFCLYPFTFSYHPPHRYQAEIFACRSKFFRFFVGRPGGPTPRQGEAEFDLGQRPIDGGCDFGRGFSGCGQLRNLGVSVLRASAAGRFPVAPV